MKKSQLLIIALVVAVIAITIGTYFAFKPKENSEAAFLDKYGLSGLTVEEMVQKLDSTTADPAGLSASITGEYLILKDSANEVKLALPQDKFYLSFAPYVNESHPCGTHSLASCQGELVDQSIHATITGSDGKEIVDSDMTTMANGFVGVWLPRDIDATLTVLYNGLSAWADISTYAGSDTCLTTPLKLN